MLSYYGYTISPNQIETGEGFLICRNVPVARTGIQEYLGSEIGLFGSEANKVIQVIRPPEEVFSPAALASFEGKPVTNDHPPELLDPDNVSMYLKGHAEQIRKGSGDWEGYMIADLHVQDRMLIDAIQAGKREISCGYECEYVKNGDGTYSQKNIRGNHIAVVDRGRAGKLAAILDSDKAAENKETQAVNRPERKKMKKNGLFLKLFGQAVKDKSPEEIEQMAMDAADALDEEGTEPGTPSEEGTETTPAADESVIDGIVEKVLAKLAAKKGTEGKDSLDAMIEKLSEDEEQDGTGEEAHVVPAEEMGKGSCGMDRALAASILKVMRPAVAAIQDEKERKAVADALIQCVSSSEASDTAKILEVAQKNAKAAKDKKPSLDLDAIQAAYDRRNPHSVTYGKEEK